MVYGVFMLFCKEMKWFFVIAIGLLTSGCTADPGASEDKWNAARWLEKMSDREGIALPTELEILESKHDSPYDLRKLLVRVTAERASEIANHPPPVGWGSSVYENPTKHFGHVFPPGSVWLQKTYADSEPEITVGWSSIKEQD